MAGRSPRETAKRLDDLAGSSASKKLKLNHSRSELPWISPRILKEKPFNSPLKPVSGDVIGTPELRGLAEAQGHAGGGGKTRDVTM